MDNLHEQHNELENEIHALERLSKLKDSGVLDDIEFREEKNKILHHTLEPANEKVSKKTKSSDTDFFSKNRRSLLLTIGCLILAFLAVFFYQRWSKTDNLREIVEATKAGDALRVTKLLEGDSTLVHTSENLVVIAVATNKRDLVTLLLQYHANPNGFDNKGMSALAYAVDHGDTTLINLLIASSALIEIGTTGTKEIPAQTPLIIAAKKGRPESASVLLARGAEVNTKDVLGKSALDYAIEGGKIKVTTVLMRYGAHPTLPKAFTVYLVGKIYTIPCKFKIYIDDYGERSCGEFIATLNSEYGYRNVHSLYLTEGDYSYSVDLENNTAIRSLNDTPGSKPKGIDIESLIGSSNTLSLVDAKIDTAFFDGKVCQLLNMKDYANNQARCWLWNGVPLKLMIWKYGQEFINLRVEKIDENVNFKEDRFQLPKNVVVTN